MIFFVRHGEAAAKWGDHPDPGLSETGRAQAEAVAAFLASQKIDAVLTSPMQRCQETAAPFCQLSGLSAQIDAAFTEIPTPSDVTDRVPWLRALMSGEWS
ncbi:MAG: histidine phosphatase family protein, partial [Pseudomonadota bacterium]